MGVEPQTGGETNLPSPAVSSCVKGHIKRGWDFSSTDRGLLKRGKQSEGGVVKEKILHPHAAFEKRKKRRGDGYIPTTDILTSYLP